MEEMGQKQGKDPKIVIETRKKFHGEVEDTRR